MQISITEAKSHLTELVRRAEAGDDIVLTRHGKAAVRLVPVVPAVLPESRSSVMKRAQISAMTKASNGDVAARSQDFLYREDGLP